MTALRRWVDFWDHREHPRSLALTRVGLGLVILWDFLEIRRLGLVNALFGVQQAGGLSDATFRAEIPLFYRIAPPTEASATWLWAATTLLAFTFTIGFFTRTSAALLLLLWAQQAQILPASDRGIDNLCRDMLLILAFSRAGSWLSADAAIARSQGLPPATAVPAWPRYLVVLQLVVMYFMAGVQKVGVEWGPFGHFSALYLILQDPAIAKHDFAWVGNQPWFFFSQLGTFGTVAWQWTYPLVLLWFWLEARPDRGGRLGRFARAWHPERFWILLGFVFHAQLWLTTELGIFPWAMMACYPALVRPGQWATFGDRFARKPAPAVSG